MSEKTPASCKQANFELSRTWGFVLHRQVRTKYDLLLMKKKLGGSDWLLNLVISVNV